MSSAKAKAPAPNADGVVVVHQHELPIGAGDVVGEREIAERLGVEVQTVAAWVYRGKGKHGTRRRAGADPFPPARWSVSGVPAWYWPDVEVWAIATGRYARPRP